MNIETLLWPKAFLIALPELLSVLVSGAKCQSLERLQLNSLEVKIVAPKPTLGSARFVDQKMEEQGPTLFLSGTLLVGEQAVALVKISYFKRGQRKYFKAEPKDFKITHEQPLAAIDLPDIAQFFADLGQANNFFSDQGLSQLNGIMKPNVPSQMIIKLLLEQVASVAQKEQKLVFHFVKAVKINQALIITSGCDDQGQNFAVLADGEKAAELFLMRFC